MTKSMRLLKIRSAQEKINAQKRKAAQELLWKREIEKVEGKDPLWSR